MATAIAHSSTLTRLARLRKRPARSTALRTCGLASVMSRSRSPGLLWAMSQALKALDAGTLAREQCRVAHAAAGLDQLRGRQIRRIHEQARRQLGEGAALVGAGDQHAADAQRGGADGEL